MTNATTNTIVAPDSSRAERRRTWKRFEKAQDYRKSGFVDRAVYAPFQATAQRPGKDRFTPEQLHQRAVARKDQSDHTSKLRRDFITASKAGDTERRQTAKTRRRVAYLAGLAKPQPAKYKNSSARRRGQEAPLAMAA